MSERLYSEQQVSAAVEKVISNMLARGELIRPGDLPQKTPQYVLVSREDLDDMLASWEDAANYKGDYLREKHGDAEEIAKYRERYASTRPERETCICGVPGCSEYPPNDAGGVALSSHNRATTENTRE